jgi:hypothetical protein
MAGDERSPFIDIVLDDSSFDSTLEIPTSGDPNANATLTLFLRYKLEFADSNNRVANVILNVEGTPRAKDGTGFAHYIADWDDKSRSNFTRLMLRSEKIWTYKFLLIPPRNYNGLDFKHPLPGHYVRPNVMCALRMEPWGKPHIKITVVRVTGPAAFRASTNRVAPRNILLDESAPRSLTLGHELGHALGMLHIKALLGDQACIADDNAPRCYGETPQEQANIMGGGPDLWPLNAQPWLDRIEVHTKTQKAFWTATLEMKKRPETLTFAQHVFRMPFS